MFDCVEFSRWILSHPDEEILSDFKTMKEYDRYNSSQEELKRQGKIVWHKSPQYDVVANFLSRNGVKYHAGGSGAYWQEGDDPMRISDPWLPDHLRYTFRRHLGVPCTADHCLLALSSASETASEIYHWRCFAIAYHYKNQSGPGYYAGIHENSKLPQEYFDILANQPGVDPRYVEIWKAHL